jgi:hypothetical protein
MPEELKFVANAVIKAYSSGLPVIIFAADGGTLHGEETLNWIKDIGISIYTVMIQGIDRQAFERCELPEICEAARQIWLADTFPK